MLDTNKPKDKNKHSGNWCKKDKGNQLQK